MNNTTWTQRELKTLKVRFKDGLDDAQIARELGRSSVAVMHKRQELRLLRKRGKQPTLVQGKYTRAKSGVKEVSILWGLIKWTRS